MTASALAAAIRADLEDANRGTSAHAVYVCRGCQRTVRHSLNASDGYCDSCNGIETPVDPVRRREARRQLHRDTAMLLRRAGFPERAAWHDAEAER